MKGGEMHDTRVPIFDSLCHPSLNGEWLSPIRHAGGNSFTDTVESMLQAGVRWAWAVAMGTSGGYEPEAFVKACREVNAEADVTLLPAAFMRPSDFADEAEIDDWLQTRKRQGFRGIKLHPRLGQFSFDHPLLAAIIRSANRHELIPFLCTYCYSVAPGGQTLTIDGLRTMLHAVPDAKLVLLHGGAERLLEVAEITRHFKKVLLDVSWTLCEFAGSSIDMDLRYIFTRAHHRVCIGSDAPEYTPTQMRARFEQLTCDLTLEVREQIAYRNLLTFSGICDIA